MSSAIEREAHQRAFQWPAGTFCVRAAEGRRNLAYNRRVPWKRTREEEEERAKDEGRRERTSAWSEMVKREEEGEKEREEDRDGKRTRARELGVLRVLRWCVMAQRGGNTDVGIRCPLRPVPIPSMAITYNNDGLVEARGRSDFNREEREREDTAG